MLVIVAAAVMSTNNNLFIIIDRTCVHEHALVHQEEVLKTIYKKIERINGTDFSYASLR